MLSVILSAMLTASILSPCNTQTIQGTVQETALGSVYIETTDGNGWYLEDRTDFTNGQKVTITFNNMGTETIYDDVIIAIR